jgi:phenylalanyl-tRNA synthetase alpha chain
MHHLKRSLRSPVRIFEVGPCFRKESKGCSHLEEFTMLNLVEMEPEISPEERLPEIIALVMDTLGLNYDLVSEESEVYGVTIDVIVDDVEVASASFGPHSLDDANGINVPWAGVGFGIERLAQMINGDQNIKRVGRSLIYLDGVRLDI